MQGRARAARGCEVRLGAVGCMCMGVCAAACAWVCVGGGVECAHVAVREGAHEQYLRAELLLQLALLCVDRQWHHLDRDEPGDRKRGLWGLSS